MDTPSRGVTLGAFICGLVSEEAPYSKDSDRINRIDRIKPSANPVNPVHPVQSGSSFSAAPDINELLYIKQIYLSSGNMHPFEQGLYIYEDNETIISDNIHTNIKGIKE
ncbi:MAG: hypothetical protein KKG76_11260 [Euryarchaeota archaeon]|nr:hypothetical protein [Euryarchaeota archaeon]